MDRAFRKTSARMNTSALDSLFGRFARSHPPRPVHFVSGNFCFMFQRETDVIEPCEQALALKIADFERSGKTMIVTNDFLLQIDGKFVIPNILRLPHQFRDSIIW